MQARRPTIPSSAFFLSALPLLWSARLLLRIPAGRESLGLALYVGLLILYLTAVLYRERAGPTLCWSWAWTWLPVGLLSGCALFVLGGLGYAFSAGVLDLPPPAETSLLIQPTALRFGLLLASALCAAAIEEAVFRGWLVRSLDRLPDWTTALVSSALFASYHLSLFQLAPTFILGLGLAALVLRTGSLWPAVLAHGLFNGLGLTLSMSGFSAPTAG